jgi:DNA-directed RNA polymerase subunit F
MTDLTIFISHKMPKDSDAARRIGNLIASYSGNKIRIILAEDFQKGRELTPEITEAIQSADIFILLYTGEDQDWGYCLLEAGQFQTALSKDQTRAIVVFHDPGVSKPRALSQYISVPIAEEQVYEFLHQLYVEREIYPGIEVSFLHKTATEICREFDYTHVIAINFDLVPISPSSWTTPKRTESSSRTKIFQPKRCSWGRRTGSRFSERTWPPVHGHGRDLSGDWADNDIYEPELARMLRTANKKSAPQGCFIRPIRSDDLYRLTLRRYEEIDGATRLKFYFTAAPIDIPIFGIHDTTNKEELDSLQYDKSYLVCTAELIDQLYWELLGYVNSTQDEVLKIADVVSRIRDELRSLEIQSSIRGIARPQDVVGVVDLTTTMKDERSYNVLLKKYCSVQGKSRSTLSGSPRPCTTSRR